MPFGRSGADENGVEAFGEQLLHALDAVAKLELGTHADDVVDFPVEHFGGQAERRDVGAHQAAGHRQSLEDHHVVAQGQQVVGHRQGRGARADAGHALAVLLRRRLRQAVGVVVRQVGRHALQAADRDRLVFHATAAAGRLAGPVADAAEDAGKNVRLAVQQEGVGVLALGDQPDVAGHIGVRGARPLAVDNLVKVVGIPGIGRLHAALVLVKISGPQAGPKSGRGLYIAVPRGKSPVDAAPCR